MSEYRHVLLRIISHHHIIISCYLFTRLVSRHIYRRSGKGGKKQAAKNKRKADNQPLSQRKARKKADAALASAVRDVGADDAHSQGDSTFRPCQFDDDDTYASTIAVDANDCDGYCDDDDVDVTLVNPDTQREFIIQISRRILNQHYNGDPCKDHPSSCSYDDICSVEREENMAANNLLTTYGGNERNPFDAKPDDKAANGFVLEIPILKRFEDAKRYWKLRWNRRLQQLIRYKEKHGDFNVSAKKGANKQLGGWAKRQRAQYHLYRDGKKAKISTERIAKLNEIGFEWDLSHLNANQPNRGAWEAKLAQLVAYKEKHGDCNVLQKCQENKQLGNWVSMQRKNYQLRNKGKKSSMTDERIAKLNEIGMSWDPLAEKWERHFALLEQYCEREGHCDVPRSHEEDEVKLGVWVDIQRQVRKGKQGVLGADRIERLDNLGIRWSFSEL